MEFYRSLFLSVKLILLFSASLIISSCENGKDKSSSAPVQSSAPTETNVVSPATDVPRFSSGNMEVKTFEVKDSTGKSKGWGYDIYIESKKTIHQPIIPAIPGNNAFKTESDARKTGLFAIAKMIKEGSLPTLQVKELDSLGILK